MADLSMLSGLSFSADDYASQALGTPDFSQYDATGVVTVSGFGPGVFSNADVAGGSGQDAVSAMIASVDTSTADATRLGTVVVNEIQDGSILDTYTADIIAVNGGQVLLGIQPMNTDAPGDPYNGNYALLSDSSLSVAGTDTTYSATVSNTDANAYAPPCFAAGTMIGTPAGAVAVETLRVGDVLVTGSGAHEAIVWVGHRHVDIARHPQPETVRPVRILAGAFADGIPSRDLLLSPDHSVHADGVLIPAKLLVNGRNVVVADLASVTYHHVELGRHDVVLANGLPAETYLDTGNRTSFNGQAEPVFVPFPDFSSVTDVNFFTWESQGCAPLALTGPTLEGVRAHLSIRADQAARGAVRAAA